MAGLLVNLLLLPGPVVITRGLRLDIHTMLVASAACIVGVQSVCFALIANDYAVTRKLIPPSPRYRPLSLYLPLERVLALGSLMFVAGLAGLSWAVWQWSETNFGDLDYSRVLRLVILSVAGLAIGAQLILTGFLAGVIAIGHRD